MQKGSFYYFNPSLSFELQLIGFFQLPSTAFRMLSLEATATVIPSAPVYKEQL